MRFDSIPSTKRTFTLILSELTEHKKTMIYDVGNPLIQGQTQKCGRVKPVNGVPTTPS
jgi:hypothetical protein